MRFSLAIGAAVVVSATGVAAHGPATAIGRAVEALAAAQVSYDPGAVVSDVEAGGFPAIVGPDVSVAFLPASAAEELEGGSEAIAAEIAAEARLGGTLVVLVGDELGAWSADVARERLGELVRDAGVSSYRSASPAARVEALVRAVRGEPQAEHPPWGWIALATGLGAAALLGLLDRRSRRAA